MRKENMWLCVLPRTQESVVQFIWIQQRFPSFGLYFAAVRWRGNYTYEALLLSSALSIYCGSQRAAQGFVYSWVSEKNFSGRDQIHPDDCSKCLSDGAWMWLTLDGAKCGVDKAPKQSSASGFGVYDFWWGMCRSSIFVWVVFPASKFTDQNNAACSAKQIGPKNKSFENWHILPLTCGSVYVKVVTGMKALILSCLWLWMTHIPQCMNMYSK